MTTEPLQIAVTDIHNTKVKSSLINGEVVYVGPSAGKLTLPAIQSRALLRSRLGLRATHRVLRAYADNR